MKLTYICDHTPEENQFGAVDSRGYENTYPKITMEFEATTIETMLRQFKDFLLGCGFVIEGEIGELESPGTRVVDELRKESYDGESEK